MNTQHAYIRTDIEDRVGQSCMGYDEQCKTSTTLKSTSPSCCSLLCHRFLFGGRSM